MKTVHPEGSSRIINESRVQSCQLIALNFNIQVLHRGALQRGQWVRISLRVRANVQHRLHSPSNRQSKYGKSKT